MKHIIWLINKILMLVVLVLVIWGWGWALIWLIPKDEDWFIGLWAVIGLSLALTFLKAVVTSPGESIDD